MPTLTKQLQEKYCLNESDKCARFIVNQKFIEGYTPKNDEEAAAIERSFDVLYPSNIDKAEQIIDQLEKE